MEATPYLVFNEESATVAATDEQYFQQIPVAFSMETNAAQGTDSGNNGFRGMKNCEGDEGSGEVESDMFDLLCSRNPGESDLQVLDPTAERYNKRPRVLQFDHKCFAD